MKLYYSGILLTPYESQILPLLAEGLSYREICQRLDLYPISKIHSHLHRIRMKTGIRNTHDREDCAAFLRQYSPVFGHPTPQQVRCLRLYVDRVSHQEIAHQLGITVQSAMNHVCEGIKRMGIRGNGIHRREQINAILDSYESADDPMSDPVFN
jgi:DNA-binding CsgD family transcriptional regulator